MVDFGKKVFRGMMALGLVGIVQSGCDRSSGPDEATTSPGAVEGEVSALSRGKASRRPPGRAGLNGHGFRGHSRHGRHVFSGRADDAGNDGRSCHGGAGGRGGPPPSDACAGIAPSGPAITGSPVSPAGGTYTYAAPNLSAPTVDPITSADGVLQGLNVSANPGVTSDPANSWTGLGLYFSAPPCVDATTYTGVKFTIAGDLGTCRLSFVGVPSEDNAVANGPVGTCTAADCISPSFGPITTGTTIVHFSEMSGGQPLATLDAAALNDIGWQLDVPTDGSPACTARFTITDVSFVNDTPRAACTGAAPASSVITDFSDAVAVGPGTAIFAGGGTFTYASILLAPPVLSLVSTDGTAAGQQLAVSVDSGIPPAGVDAAWDGFGLYFNMCTDASTYSGIKFTVAGDLGACPLQFSAQFSENDDVAADPTFGSCTAPLCFAPWTEPVGLGTTTVRFTDLVGGNPMTTVDTARLTGIHWQFMPPTGASAASCKAQFTVDDVAFVP